MNDGRRKIGASRRGEAPCNLCACEAQAWAPTTRGGVAIVSAQDADLLRFNHWTRMKNGYAVSGPGYLHKTIVKSADGNHVDHANGNRLDCQRDNLRECTPQQTCFNQGRNSRNTSGFKGVSLDRRSQRWVAYIKHNGRRRHLGTFSDKAEAALAYNKAAVATFGQFARLNRIPEHREAA